MQNAGIESASGTGAGVLRGLRRAQLGAAKPGCACKRNPLRFLWLALAPQAIFPNDNIGCSGRVRMPDLTLAPLAWYGLRVRVSHRTTEI